MVSLVTGVAVAEIFFIRPARVVAVPDARPNRRHVLAQAKLALNLACGRHRIRPLRCAVLAG